MGNRLRWGLLSTAKINQALIAPLRSATRSELAAVASRSQERAAAYAIEHAIPTVHDSYEALLADPAIDVIYNPLPNSLHAAWTIKAAEAGKHVLCEKPLTLSLAELDRVEAAAKANDVTIFEAFMYLHHPQTRTVLRLVEEDRIGNLRLINSWFNFFLPPANADNIRLNPELGGGSLWDVGVYPNSLAIILTGGDAPAEVWAQQVTAENDVEVMLAGQMRFGSGAVAQISSGFRTPFREGAYLVGDAGIIHVPEPWKPGEQGEPSRITVTGLDDQEEVIEFEGITPYAYEIEAMEACVLDGAEPVVPLSLSRNFLRSVLALYESARTGMSVSLDA
jgi:xylose dehydrogenase (NAD/NADP)